MFAFMLLYTARCEIIFLITLHLIIQKLTQKSISLRDFQFDSIKNIRTQLCILHLFD